VTRDPECPGRGQRHGGTAAAAALAPYLEPGTVLPDTGSVKSAVVAQVQPHLPPGVSFVPPHPSAGTEFSGPDAGLATRAGSAPGTAMRC